MSNSNTCRAMMSKVIPIFMSLIVFACFAGQSVQAQDDLPECEGNDDITWLNANITCPLRAVCADVIDSVREYQGFKPDCREHRVNHRCMCPGEGGTTTTCPFENTAHRFYASKKQKSYTCQPACTLPYCTDSPQYQTDKNAVTIVERDNNFGGKRYYRMECRCPRHHQPLDGPRTHRAVESNGRGHFTETHKCRIETDTERNMQDPCRD